MLLSVWLAKERSLALSPTDPKWFRRRGYLHFDLPIGPRKAASIVTAPSKVARHAFYPLLNYSITAEKVAKDGSSKKLIIKEKHRPIAYAAHVDAHIYAYYSEQLTNAYEAQLAKRNLGDVVLAFRSLGKSNIDFAKQAFKAISNFGECGVVALDISGFFDNINHQILKEKWASLLGTKQLPADHYNVFKSITQHASVDRDEVYRCFGISKHNPKHDRYRICSSKDFRTVVRGGKLINKNRSGKGIPQGSPISALLSNIYLIDFDEKVKTQVDWIGGLYYRYCDDMLLIVPESSKDAMEAEVIKLITALKVEINKKKTEVVTFRYKGTRLLANRPLQYLGFLFDGEQITIRSAALARYSQRMKRAVRRAKMTKLKRNRIKIASGQQRKPLYKRKLFEKYSHLGKRNFIRYGLRAAEKMESAAIKRQLKPLWQRLQDEIDK